MQEAAGAEEVLDTPGACELLKIKERTLRKWLVDKAIPHAKIGGRLRFRRSSLLSWIADHERRTMGEAANG